MSSFIGWRTKAKAAGYHLLLSGVVTALVAVLVFFVWYPYPLWKISGGIGLFGLVVVCDFVLGPLFTLIIYNPKKSRRELVMDLSLIALIQLAALSFGVWTVLQARPVYLVFERDMYRVIRTTDIPESLMAEIPKQFRHFPLSGPKFIALRGFSTFGEQLAATTAELEGQSLSAQPKFWAQYDHVALNIGKKGKPLALFKTQFPEVWKDVERILSNKALAAEDVVFYPFVDKTIYWTVFIRKSDGLPIGFLPVDPYPE